MADYLGWDEGVPQMTLGERAILTITRYAYLFLELCMDAGANELLVTMAMVIRTFLTSLSFTGVSNAMLQY